uniref:Uncharacterized protein n=1 Tax=Anguilla anguilla TaxID=7936 RepID=A0A0E9PLM8_ANGAN
MNGRVRVEAQSWIGVRLKHQTVVKSLCLNGGMRLKRVPFWMYGTLSCAV